MRVLGGDVGRRGQQRRWPGCWPRPGHEVIGVTLQLYDHGAAIGRKGACCAGQDIHDARRVADRLGIPHYVIDAEARFRDAVIADFADSYARRRDAGALRALQPDGEVHRPDGAGARPRRASGWRPAITCGAIDGAGRAGAAPRRRSGARPELVPVRHHAGATGGAACSRSARWRTRRAVRAAAERLGLPVAAKPDSQDICFVPAGSYADVVGAAAAGRAGARRDRRPRPARCWAATTASRATRWARRSGWAPRRRTAGCGAWWSGWTRHAARGGRPARRRQPRTVRLRERELARRAARRDAAR